MTRRVANHLHRYKKVNLGTKDKPYMVYKCTKPACSHYVPVRLAEGKLCECNRCGEPMILSKRQMVASSGRPLSKPHCNNCFKGKDSDDVAAIAAFLDEKIGS